MYDVGDRGSEPGGAFLCRRSCGSGRHRGSRSSTSRTSCGTWSRASIANPRDAKKYGIETIYQTLALADNVDAAANLYLGRELRTKWGTLDDVAMEAEARKVMASMVLRKGKGGSPPAPDAGVRGDSRANGEEGKGK